MKKKTKASYERQLYIIKKASALIDEGGLKNVTIADICKEAEISVGAFYHYFDSKEDIIYKMYDCMDFYFKENMPKGSSYSRAIEFTRLFIDYTIKNGYYINRLVLLNSIEQSNTLKESSREVYKILNSILEDGIKEGDIKHYFNSEELTELIFTALRGHLLIWAKRGVDYPLKEKAVSHTEILLSHFFAK